MIFGYKVTNEMLESPYFRPHSTNRYVVGSLGNPGKSGYRYKTINFSGLDRGNADLNF